MTNKTKTTLLLLTLVSGIIFMTGCKKNAASIVGTWTETTQREQEKIGGTSVYDTTFNVGTPTPTVTFNADGSFNSNNGSIGAGTYSLAGSTLTVIDTGTGGGTHVLTVATLTTNALSLQMSQTDTASPYPTYNYWINFKR